MERDDKRLPSRQIIGLRGLASTAAFRRQSANKEEVFGSIHTRQPVVLNRWERENAADTVTKLTCSDDGGPMRASG
ncbi:unnamed protein product [Fusarium graminearum]|uniref:Uncharacterized protein n=1 Tax=Gibberella zeae TaxID=5518 RepID=A0A9N8WXL8_GIBZA|nr:unnamed protein product [Fusarium graminearum]CAG2000643.1 unnamed protein product [Fusarium graminearum]